MAGTGTNYFKAGTGTDTFSLAYGNAGNSTIYGFDPTHDHIDIVGPRSSGQALKPHR